MKHKAGVDKSPCKVISIKNYKEKRINKVSSTIAAIIAIKIEHPSDITPEDYFLNNIEKNENIEIIAFEDALDNNIGQTSGDASNGALNDAWYNIYKFIFQLILRLLINFHIWGNKNAANNSLYKSPMINGVKPLTIAKSKPFKKLSWRIPQK